MWILPSRLRPVPGEGGREGVRDGRIKLKSLFKLVLPSGRNIIELKQSNYLTDKSLITTTIKGMIKNLLCKKARCKSKIKVTNHIYRKI